MDVELESTGPAPVPPAAQQVMVAMRDGVRLATDVYRPAGPGPWPAVLVRLPYDKDGRYTFMPWLAPRFTARGYAFVVQDVRGKFRSEGEALALHPRDRRRLGHASTGSRTRRGATARSACSATPTTASRSGPPCASGHPALRAIVPRVTAPDLGTTWLRRSRGRRCPAACRLPRLLLGRTATSIDGRSTGAPRPLAKIFDQAAGRPSGSRSADAGRPADAARASPAVRRSGGRPVRRAAACRSCTRSAGSTTLAAARWATTMRLASKPAWAPLQYLRRRLRSTTRTTASPTRRSTRRADHAHDEEALARMLPRYVGPALDFFDVFLTGTDATRRRCRGSRWNLGHAGWHGAAARWPPAGATRAARCTWRPRAGRRAPPAELARSRRDGE